MGLFRRKTKDPLDPQNLANDLGIGPLGFRMTAEMVLEMTGRRRGAIVNGQISEGTITKGAKVRYTRPDGSSHEITVDGLVSPDGDIDRAQSGEWVGLVLRKIKHGEISKGDVLGA